MGVGAVATGAPDFDPDCVMCGKVSRGEYTRDDHHDPAVMRGLFHPLANGRIPRDLLE